MLLWIFQVSTNIPRYAPRILVEYAFVYPWIGTPCYPEKYMALDTIRIGDIRMYIVWILAVSQKMHAMYTDNISQISRLRIRAYMQHIKASMRI